METPSVRFSSLLLCLASFFSFFLFLSFLSSLFLFPCTPGMFIFVPLCAAAICYSQLLSEGTYFIVRVLSAGQLCRLYPTPSRNYFVFYF